jgi:hypothetical protein
MTQLSEHFTLEQLTFSEIAVRKGLANDPTPEQVANLTDLAATLERVWQVVGPIHINSALRTPKVNAAVGGSVTSAHLDGYAGDFTAPGFGSPLDVCKAIAGSDIPFDQLIAEGYWAHISIALAMRRQVLTAHFLNGKVAYTQGLEVA